MLYSILIVAQVIISIGLITLVLLQQGKGADAGAAFGSGASSTVFGSRGSANFLSRSTAVLAALFFLNSLGMAFLISNQPTAQSVVDQAVVQEQVKEQAPAKQDIPATDEPVKQDIPVVDEAVKDKQPASQPVDVPE
jgi:preprotein translocase subunit SecG